MGRDSVTDPNMPTESPLAAVLIVVLMLAGIPFALWVAMTWTRQRWANAWRTITAPPPSHAAHEYQTCVIHGQRIPRHGDCAMCVVQLYEDLEALETGE